MKKTLTVLTLAISGLLLTTGVANAGTYSHYRGENPCLFTLGNLQSHGYSEKNTYTTEAIKDLLNRIDIKAQNVETLIPGQSYQVSYSCNVDHGAGRVTLQALPINNPSHVITNINWIATKPSQ